MLFRSKIKWAALAGLVLSFLSLIFHLFLAKASTAELVEYATFNVFTEDLTLTVGGRQSVAYRKLWSGVKSLDSLLPYSNPRTTYPGPPKRSNGFIYAKIYGEFGKIRNSIVDLVVVSRLLNATLVIPELQESSGSKGISSKYTSFSYLYNVEQFIAALKDDVVIVKSLPAKLKEGRKSKQYPTLKPSSSASASYYTNEVLPLLEKSKVIGLVISDGGCLQNTLPPSLVEYQRLRCRVSFHALSFRNEILALGRQMVQRLRSSGQPYLAYYPGLIRETLAYHGCAELFQDIHTELIQHLRAKMIKQHIINEELSVDSHAQKMDGACPLMPEEVGLLLRAVGYPPTTRIYLAGAETFGGQRVVIPLRAMYTNLVDRTSLCSKQELLDLLGPETTLQDDPVEPPPAKSLQQLKKEWDKAGSRPRPLPPPPDRPFYRHEKEGWYGWIAEKDVEPEPTLTELRQRAHRLLWAALDYIVSVEAEGFIPGFHNDGSPWPEFSSLVMGHRLYEMASSRTYRPNRKYLAGMFGSLEHLYHPKHNWTLAVREHLNKSLGQEVLRTELKLSKPSSFLSYPVPECSCRSSSSVLGSVYEDVDECPQWMKNSFESRVEDSASGNETFIDEAELPEQGEVDDVEPSEARPSMEQDEEMDPDD
ncbi:EMBRYO SAC DEVELOPMENT ARREST 30-like protein [Drosera capensis]